MIEVENLNKTIKGRKILNNINFNVQQGEILGLLGPNGAGKTSIMRILTGFWKPIFGKVSFDGMNLADNLYFLKKRLGYLPEHAPLYDDMKVFEYLKFIAEIREIQSEKLLPRLKEVIADCGLQTAVGRTIGELSKGFRQRVGLAQAIIHNPDILILDEPTTGLDPNQIMEIRSLIKEIGKAKTVIFSTHILAEASATCDRVIIVNQGEIVSEGSPENPGGNAWAEETWKNFFWNNNKEE